MTNWYTYLMDLHSLTIPTHIHDSTEFVMQHALDVSIDPTNIREILSPIQKRFAQGFDTVEDAFGSTGDKEKDINLVYFETAANFCFWSQNPSNKWVIEHNGSSSGGWYGLRNAFARALDNGIPVYDAAFMSELTLSQAADIFRGQNDVQIPLLEWRLNNIVEAATFLLGEHDGQAENFLAACNYDAPTIAYEIARKLDSYRDGGWYKNNWVWLLKRAQILPNDLAQLTQKYPDFTINNLDKVTIFADYRLPQILRHYGVLKYSEKLSTIVDNKKLLPHGSSMEIEIRAATIVACQQISKLLPGMATADIDVSLWLLSQDMRNDPTLKPHHFTYSYFY